MAADTHRKSTDDSIQIILIGSTGSGKSSTGNTILDNKHFISEASAKSVTLKCKSADKMLNGRQVTVVDTPGWDCTELSKYEVAAKIQDVLQNLRGPYSFLLVIRVGSVESDDISKIYSLKEVLGPSYLEHTTILFSHSDNLEWKTFEEFLQEGGAEFQALLRSCNNRCHYWNNRDERSDENVENVLRDLKKTEAKDQNSEMRSQSLMHTDRVETPLAQKGICENKSRDLDPVSMDTQKSKQPIRVLFLGMSKVGKTSSIRSLQRKCEQTEDKDVYKFSTARLSLRLVDSPGFDENPNKIQEVVKSVSTTEPHVIVIVMTVDRFGSAVKKTMQHIQRFLGQEAAKYTMILFTGKDNLEGKPIESFIEENADLREIVALNGRRFHALNNRDASDHRQVDELLQKIADMYMTNNGNFYKIEEESSDPRHEKGGKKGSWKWFFG